VDDIEAMFARLEAEAQEELLRDGFAREQTRLDRTLDMRYAGQGYEIAVACSADLLQSRGIEGLRRNFDALHQSMFGHVAPDEPVEVVSWRLRAIGLVPAPPMPTFAPAGIAIADALRERRQVQFDGARLTCPVYQRERLDVGLAFAGPAIIDQFDSTTVVCPGQLVQVDRWKNLIITEDTDDH
jgi:N-methylhydantoinase A